MPSATDLIAELRKALLERVYEGGKTSWRYRYTPADLAPMVEDYARQFHVARLTDAGFELVPIPPPTEAPPCHSISVLTPEACASDPPGPAAPGPKCFPEGRR